jgi:two-component system LytT family response regulator
MTIRTILVDDEKLAIQGLQAAAGESSRCRDRRNLPERARGDPQDQDDKPDLVFLDIQMPGFDGFSVVQGVMEIEPPLFVFVTAYSGSRCARLRGAGGGLPDEARRRDSACRHAGARAQCAWAKRRPPRRPRSSRGARRSRARGDERPCPTRKRPPPTRYEKLINIKDRGQIFRVDVDSIERIEAAGDYMCIYTADNSLILRETMKDLEKRLDPRVFQRVHRSTIVNLNQVRQVKPHTNGECFLVLESGAQVKVSRSYRDVVARFVH